MAEFVEVMKQFKRMCKCGDDENNCEKCGLYRIGDSWSCFTRVINNPAVAENVIMEWAAENPEPQYPTWEQWQRSICNAPYNDISPCMFIDPKRLNCGGTVKGGLKCKDCRKQRIPADIAEKLGIKPGEEWE